MKPPQDDARREGVSKRRATLAGSKTFQLAFVLSAVSIAAAADSAAEKLIAAGHWKQARAIVEPRIRQAPDDPLANFLLSQIRNAFGERATPLPLAEKAVALDGRVAKYHRQLAEVVGVMSQRANPIQLLLFARRFRKEIDAALALDPTDTQAQRDLMEFYLRAPGIAGGDRQKAAESAERIVTIDAAEGFLAKARLATLLERPAETESWLRKAAAAQPPSYLAQIALAQFYLAPERSNLAAAEAPAKEALKLDGGRVDAYAILAAIYARRSEWSSLDAILAVAAREASQDLVPHYRAAEELLVSGRDLARAERYLRAYLSQEPEGNEPSAAEAKGKLGSVLQLEGRNSRRMN